MPEWLLRYDKTDMLMVDQNARVLLARVKETGEHELVRWLLSPDRGRIDRTLDTLRRLRDPSLHRMTRPFLPRLLRDPIQDGDDHVLVYEYVGSNLRRLLVEEANGLHPATIRRVMYDLLGGLSVLHYHLESYHDIRPEAIMIGVREGEGAVEERRFARLAAQALTGRQPLFKGCGHVVSWDYFRLLGSRKQEEEWPGMPLAKEWYTYPKFTVMDIKEALSKVVPELDQEGIDLLSRMLVCNPVDRISADDALKHRYFSQWNGDEVNPMKDWPETIEVDVAGAAEEDDMEEEEE